MIIQPDTRPTTTVHDHEHLSWCNPRQCFVVRPERWKPTRRTVHHRSVVNLMGVVVEAYQITHQDPGGPVEVDVTGVSVLHIEDTEAGPADPLDVWGGIALAAMSAGSAAAKAVQR